MNKNVIISVKGTQGTEGQEPNKLELVTEGKYYKKGSVYYVSYKESDLTGMEGTTTTLKITKDGIVTLMRFGVVNSQFVFEKGQRHMSYYDTTMGTFTVSVFAKQVNINVDDSGGEVSVDYQLEIDDNKPGYNDFHLFIRETSGGDDEEFCVDSLVKS